MRVRNDRVYIVAILATVAAQAHIWMGWLNLLDSGLDLSEKNPTFDHWIECPAASFVSNGFNIRWSSLSSFSN